MHPKTSDTVAFGQLGCKILRNFLCPYQERTMVVCSHWLLAAFHIAYV